MFLLRAHRLHPAFAQGYSDLAGAAPGIAAWGLMTGVAMVKSGMSTLEAFAMALMVFAGSSQLAAVPLLVAGAPIWVIVATAFCVNLRFVVFSAHMRAYVMHLPRWQRLVTGYLTADLTYVMFVKRFPEPATDADGRAAQMAYLAGSSGLNWVSWMGASFLGIALAHAIPGAWGLGFAGVLALVGILCALASSRLRVVACGVAGAVAVAAYALPLKLNILVAIAAAVLLCLALEQRRAQAAADV
jgi:predicted branched-subunit amino acid permease